MANYNRAVTYAGFFIPLAKHYLSAIEKKEETIVERVVKSMLGQFDSFITTDRSTVVERKFI